MGLIPDTKDIIRLVEKSMEPTTKAMLRFTELLTRQVELSGLMVEMQHAQLRGRVSDATLDTRVHNALANAALAVEKR